MKIQSDRDPKYSVDHYEMYRLLGLRAKGHLPQEGMPVRDIRGVPVYVLPAKPPVFRTDGGKLKTAHHRVIAICTCGRHVPFGRLHQHKCKV